MTATISPEAPADKAAGQKPSTVEVVVVEDKNIDTTCYRGTAPLHLLASISQADVFDQVANPTGLQRDLSPKHASEAHQYVTRDPQEEFPRAFPEVMLNVRDEHVLSVEPINTGRQRSLKGFRFTFDATKIAKDVAEGKIAVSRMDGNHRLWYAQGDNRRKQADAIVPFQIHIGLSPEQETNLFVDVNANQKGLNSSHLHILRSRLTPEEQELQSHPERVFARRLAGDKSSPWYNLVFLGGSRKGSRDQKLDRPVSFVSLETGVRRTLSKSQYIHDLTQPDAQYVLIRNFWEAVREVYRDEWDKPKGYLLLKNIGVLAFSIVGGTIIDRSMARGEITVEDMKRYVKQTRDVFVWDKDATGDRSVSGMSGNRAALLVAGELTVNMTEPDSASPTVANLQEKLLGAAPEPQEEPEEWRKEPDVSDLEAAGVARSIA